MAPFLVYVFLKGPVWLRMFVWLCFASVFLYGCLSTLNTLHQASERPVPAHAYHARKH